MNVRWSYATLVDFVAARLERDARAQEEGRIWQVGQDYDLFDAALPRARDPRFEKLFVARRFWDSWIDARNHEWQYYPGLTREDWPGLARRLADDLRAGRDIADPGLLDWFGPDPRTLFGKRLRERIVRHSRRR